MPGYSPMIPSARVQRRGKSQHTKSRNAHNNINITTIGRTSRKVFAWLYSFSLVILLVVFFGLNAIMPIDSIVKSKTSHNLAVNAIIIVNECAVFIALAIVIYIVRIVVLRFSLQAIPKPYIPISPNDIPKEVSDHIHNEIRRCERIREQAGPNEVVRHPGLHYNVPHPQGINGNTANTKDSDEFADSLPNNLIYENVVRSIGEEIKYNGYLILDKEDWFVVPKNKTLRSIIEGLVERLQRENLGGHIDPELVNNTLKHYEYCRFSGKPITYEDFAKFIQLWYTLKKGIHEGTTGKPMY